MHNSYLDDAQLFSSRLRRFNQMYGVIGILDRLHGTDGMFRQNAASRRHFILLGTASAKEIITE